MRLLCIYVLISCVASFAADTPSGPFPERIDLNNASKDSLEKLPGVGPKLAEQIILGRPFKTVEELDRVKGIGPKKLAQIRPRLFVTPMTIAAPSRPATNEISKINLNTASQAELEKLPGVGPKRAEAIIKARPFRRPEDLMKVPGFSRTQFDKIKNHLVAP